MGGLTSHRKAQRPGNPTNPRGPSTHQRRAQPPWWASKRKHKSNWSALSGSQVLKQKHPLGGVCRRGTDSLTGTGTRAQHFKYNLFGRPQRAGLSESQQAARSRRRERETEKGMPCENNHSTFWQLDLRTLSYYFHNLITLKDTNIRSRIKKSSHRATFVYPYRDAFVTNNYQVETGFRLHDNIKRVLCESVAFLFSE